ncbi:hypothetical protein M8009_13040 [Halomonas sp. ATCH28]|uniref:Portal protein n=1 Tax=Halomonas gemina TaxID=2945105 RepID=A0ABT0T350_9GAMM|nr:cell envelope integrity protein TolA [Halomonas gemina]MCL7941212.1 hypothetical protein [Halomonas gemina]
MTDQVPDTDQQGEMELAAERLQRFAHRLTRMAHEQVQSRASLEQRWLEDLRQYHGEYDPVTSANLQDSEGSKVFVNITRNKTNAAEARLQDMLFPTDDRNWGIGPTPVPELEGVEPGETAQGPNGEPVDLSQIAEQVKREAKKKARAMQDEIDDQLKEGRYQIKCRDVIHDAALLGTGVIKGPVIVGRTKKRWDTQGGISQLTIEEALEPSAERVDPWDFFPDMSARHIEEAEFIFERHLWTKRQLREFARLPGVLDEQLRSVVKGGKDNSQIAKDHTNDIRAITGVDSINSTNKYEVWEYHGPISKAELLDAFDEAGEQITEEEVDELNDEVEAVVFFSGNNVLKVVLNPMDTEDRPFSVFNWEKDESAMFGFGIPYLMRQPQRVINAAWRMMLDNAGSSASDIIVANRDLIQPADGSWSSQPGKKKLYFLTDKRRNVQEAFASFTIPNHQTEFANIFTMARQLADEETNLPLIAQGEQSDHITQTSSGMAMLMNSANIVLRRAVKNWDDDITRPTISRFYDWNMQYSDDEAIKGDYTVDARGSGALLVREKQQESLLAYANISAGNPEMAIRRDWKGLDRELAKALEVPYEQVTLPDGEIEEKKQQAQEAGDPEMQLKQAEIQLKMQEAQAKAQREQQDFQLRSQQQQWEQQFEAAKLQTEQEKARLEIALKEGITLAQLEQQAGLESQKLEAQMQQTAAKLQTERDKAAAQLTEEQNDRMAREQNMANGWDSYG